MAGRQDIKACLGAGEKLSRAGAGVPGRSGKGRGREEAGKAT